MEPDTTLEPDLSRWHRYAVIHSLTGKWTEYPTEKDALAALRKSGKDYEMRHYIWAHEETTVLA